MILSLCRKQSISALEFCSTSQLNCINGSGESGTKSYLSGGRGRRYRLGDGVAEDKRRPKPKVIRAREMKVEQLPTHGTESMSALKIVPGLSKTKQL